jgi:hypothetical protein
MKSPPTQYASQLLPADRVTGIFHRLAILIQEEPAFVVGQLVQNALWVERVLVIDCRADDLRAPRGYDLW